MFLGSGGRIEGMERGEEEGVKSEGWDLKGEGREKINREVLCASRYGFFALLLRKQ